MKLMILDGNSVINRAFYGVRLLTTREGLYTNAIFGFLNILEKLRNEEQPDALAVADIVLSRAGSNTLSELLALHKPMLLVPYPLGASRGDQIENAKSYQRQGLAHVLMQEDMTPETLTQSLLELLSQRQELARTLEAYPVKDGTDAVLELIEQAQKESDNAKRMELYKEIQQKINDDAPWACLFYGTTCTGIRADLKGFVLHPSSANHYENLYYEK